MSMRKIMAIYVLLVTVYVVLSVISPFDDATLTQYDLTETQGRLINLAISLPLMAIWLAAFYGFAKFKDYAALVSGGRDGKAFMHIANGLGVLAFGLPLTSIVSVIFRVVSSAPEESPAATIVSNYLTIAMALGAFYFIHKGTDCLAKLVRTKRKATVTPLPNTFSIAALYGLLGATYVYLVLQNPIRSTTSGAELSNTYQLPKWLILTTIALPYLVVWFAGLRSVMLLRFYQSNISGLLYKRTLRLLTYGIGGVVVSTVVLQYLSALSSLLTDSTLRSILLIILLLLVMIGTGFVLIALGAKNLKKIEEV